MASQRLSEEVRRFGFRRDFHGRRAEATHVATTNKESATSQTASQEKA
jgi:hypothetical protein